MKVKYVLTLMFISLDTGNSQLYSYLTQFQFIIMTTCWLIIFMYVIHGSSLQSKKQLSWYDEMG